MTDNLVDIASDFWYIFRLFAAMVLCLLHPEEMYREFNVCQQQRQRIKALAYPRFQASTLFKGMEDETDKKDKNPDTVQTLFAQRLSSIAAPLLLLCLIISWSVL